MPFILTRKNRFYKLPAARFSQSNQIWNIENQRIKFFYNNIRKILFSKNWKKSKNSKFVQNFVKTYKIIIICKKFKARQIMKLPWTKKQKYLFSDLHPPPSSRPCRFGSYRFACLQKVVLPCSPKVVLLRLQFDKKFN